MIFLEKDRGAEGKERYFSAELLRVHASNLVCAPVLPPFDPLDALGRARER